MSGFKDLTLKNFYYPPDDDVVRDFFIPVLKKTIEYDRATGFFSSSALVELSVGICDIAKKGGKIKAITSPRLSSEDIEAIKHGYDLPSVIGESMVKNFVIPEDPESMDRLSLLSGLVSSGILELKVAVMKNLNDYPNAMFHPKFGIMSDEDGEMVTFVGSMNASENGIGGNWELLDVNSIDPIFDSRKAELKKKFDDLWNGVDQHTMVIDMPKVVNDLICSYKSKAELLDLDEKLLNKYDEPKNSVFFKSPDWVISNKRPYQEEAVQNWVNDGYRGIFNMATGTGKTITALCALERLYNENPDEGIFTIIIAPQKHLVDQWAREVRNFGVDPLVGHSDVSHGDWKLQFRRKMLRYEDRPSNLCMVTTISSFASKNIQEWLEKITNLAIVVDEAHNMGSGLRLSKLLGNAKYRLALSATMERFNDSSGTAALKNYFGKECINFALKDAIGKYLSNYNYFPILCCYSSDEYDKIVEKNGVLNEILNSSVSEKEKNKARKDYVQYSYTLNAKMNSKFDALRELMCDHVTEDHFLVYCGKVRTDDEGTFDDESHRDFISAIDKSISILGMGGLGMKVSRITYRESAEDRKRIIDEFNKGETQGIVAISCLDEGVDIPSIRTAVIMSSSDNPREYIQRRGRVLRLYPGKDHADIYDFIVIPKLLEEADPESKNAALELKILAKEILRMKEFSTSALNPEKTDSIFKKIESAYEISVNDIISQFGAE